MKTTKIGVISIKNYMQLTIDIAAGRRKAGKDMPKIWIPDLKLAKELTSGDNLELINLIATQEPETIEALEKMSGRRNLSEDLERLEQYNLIKMDRSQGLIRPVADSSLFEIVEYAD